MSEVQDLSIPVITIDGGAVTGKGTVRHLVAQELGFNELDSGILYRAVGYTVYHNAVFDRSRWGDITHFLNLRLVSEQIFLDDKDVTDILRSEEISKMASLVSANGDVRSGLREFQLAMRRAPGLVADGRDQGSLFDTSHRFFLTAKPEVKAQRKYSQLRKQSPGDDSIQYEQILKDIIARDLADETRAISPLRPHPGALVIDTSNLKPEDVAELILHYYHNPF